jgi:two-component system sensor histidine kinase AlgZ
MGWLWSGDDRLAPGFLRGLAQSLAWCGLCLAALGGGYIVLSHIAATRILSWYAFNLLLQWPLLVGVGWFIFKDILNVESRREALAQAREAQWNLLRAQLSPHFLFNALTAFAELGRQDWPRTERGLLALAEVYRNLLDLSERQEATLGEERALMENYLAVEALRLGHRLQVRWDWDPALDALVVPPLLLLPLVENALKHGLGPRPEGGELLLQGRREGACLRLEVANTGAWGEAVPRSRGVGLRNLNARLQLGYQGRATFDLVREAPWTRARLTLPGPLAL